ncbi:MAG: hypothetical protein EPO21_02890 [Chloroflexota bacterium]|nr:MAG: hypothetical protein EPO21_02890 [Chloroflexota bacterium]
MKLTENQTMIVNMVRDLAEKEFRPFAAHWDEKEEFPAQNVPKLVDAGLLGILAPKEYGGAELTVLDAALVVREIAKVCRATCTIVQIQNAIGALLMEHASPEIQKKYVPRIIAGDALGALAITEADAGSSLQDMKALAVEQDDGYLLNGIKHFVTNAPIAQIYIVFTYVRNKEGVQGIGTMLVDRNTPGVSCTKIDRFMGLRGAPHGEIVFENCLVPKENVISGGDARGLREVMTGFNRERCMNAAVCIGIGRAAVEESAKYLVERTIGGKKLANFQGLQWILADMSIKVEAAEALLFDTLADAEGGRRISGLRASRAKTFANEMSFEVAHQAMQIFGGYGYNTEFPIERLLRDARCYQIGAGTTQVLRNTIAQQILRQYS